MMNTIFNTSSIIILIDRRYAYTYIFKYTYMPHIHTYYIHIIPHIHNAVVTTMKYSYHNS